MSAASSACTGTRDSQARRDRRSNFRLCAQFRDCSHRSASDIRPAARRLWDLRREGEIEWRARRRRCRTSKSDCIFARTLIGAATSLLSRQLLYNSTRGLRSQPAHCLAGAVQHWRSLASAWPTQCARGRAQCSQWSAPASASAGAGPSRVFVEIVVVRRAISHTKLARCRPDAE